MEEVRDSIQDAVTAANDDDDEETETPDMVPLDTSVAYDALDDLDM